MKKKTAPRRNIKSRIVKKTPKVSQFSFSQGILLVVAVFFLVGYLTFRDLNSDVAGAQSTDSAIQFADRDYVLLAAYKFDNYGDMGTLSSVSVFFYDFKNPKMQKYVIDIEQPIEMAGKFSAEKLRSIPVLAYSAFNSTEAVYASLDASLSNLFGYEITRHIAYSQPKEASIETMFAGDMSYMGMLHQLLTLNTNEVHTNFTKNEFKSFIDYLNKLPESTTEATLFNESTFDEELRNFTYDSSLATERLSISILNGTTTPGLAVFGSRIVQNYGGRVISTANAQDLYSESMILTDDPDTATVRYLKEYFNINIIQEKGLYINKVDSEIYRSDVIVILGVDTVEAL